MKGLTEGRGGSGSSSTLPANQNHSKLTRETQSGGGEPGDSEIQEIVPVKMEASFHSGAGEDQQEEGYEYQDQDQEGFHYEDYNPYVSENIGLDQGNYHNNHLHYSAGAQIPNNTNHK